MLSPDMIAQNPDHVREIKRRSYHKRRAEGKPLHPNALSRPYDKKAKAQRRVQSAVQHGWLEGLRPGERPPCEGCAGRDNVHAHHHDYDKPYDVDWLCGLCHAAEHRGELVRVGPKAPAIVLSLPCAACGKATPRSELRGRKVDCDACAGPARVMWNGRRYRLPKKKV